MWTLQLHGLTDHLGADEARELETELVVKARNLFAGLVPGGHQGVAGTFSGDHVGAVNLVDPASAPEGTPAPDEGVKADGSPEPAPEGPPPVFEPGAPSEPAQPDADPPTAAQ